MTPFQKKVIEAVIHSSTDAELRRRIHELAKISARHHDSLKLKGESTLDDIDDTQPDTASQFYTSR